MSLNISSEVLKHSTVTLRMKPSTLSKRQYNSLQRMMETGVVFGNGVPALMAVKLLHSRGEPFFRYRSWYLMGWFNLPPQDIPRMDEVMSTALAMHRMTLPDDLKGHALDSEVDRVKSFEFARGKSNAPTYADMRCLDLQFSYRLSLPVELVRKCMKNFALSVKDTSIPEVIEVEYGYEDRFTSL